MIVPITMVKNGKSQTVGTASVVPEDDDFSVAFYLNPGYSFSNQVRIDMANQLKKIAREQRDRSVRNLSVE